MHIYARSIALAFLGNICLQRSELIRQRLDYGLNRFL